MIPASADPILVVGAGPAGATAARTLAAAGVPVRILDRASFPRNKPCGGGISLRVLKRFPYLEDALPRIATHTLKRLYLEGPGGASTVIESDEPAALMIRRVEFDDLLLSLALREGAELVTGADIVQASATRERVTLVARDGRRFTAPLVIAADGVHSGVARRLGLHSGWPATSIALDMMEETPRTELRDLDPSTLWIAYGYTATGAHDIRGDGPACPPQGAAEGYAYIFPKRDHVNIGIGYVLSYYRHAIEASPYELQRGFVDELRARGVVAGESMRRNFTPFMIPVGGPLRRPGRGRVLLAGDAGGFVNAFTAEGIYYAMVSGDLAARAVIKTRGVVSGDRIARRYRRACSREIGPELRDSVLVQRHLFSDRDRIARIVRNADRHPAITKLILDYAIGHRSYLSARRGLIRRSPHLALGLMWELTKSFARGRLAALGSA
ncbi:MAG: geranylgeranyl reductase [Acidobacteria bacterium]|nr:MAG: geranylgeranyl reductase [Acidobacteriota bacterium]